MIRLNAGQIQPRADPARAIAEAGETAVARLISQGLDALDESVSGALLVKFIRENRFDDVWTHLGLARIGYAIRPALNRLAMIHDTAALAARQAIDVSKARPVKPVPPAAVLAYDPRDPPTVAAQQRDNQRIIDTLEAQANAAAQAVISAGLARGDSPETIARQLRETLALSPQERAAIENYRTTLQTTPQASLSRALRDRRFDLSVRTGDLSEQQIERIVARYAQRYRSFRALRLARTESLRAANRGRAAAWAQYRALTGRDFRRFWLTAGDELVCPICAVIPGLNPQGIGPDDDYETPIGPIHAPPDPHPNCRCSERFIQI